VLISKWQNTLVAWIDADGAVAGYRVKLEHENDWWTVAQVYSSIDRDKLHTDRESHVIHDKDRHTRLKGLDL
jgi:hypothetical protein